MSSDTRHTPAPDGGLGIGGRPRILRFSHEAMATVFEVHAAHPDAAYAAQAAQAAFELLDGLERALSRFQPNSDITRINHLAAGEATPVAAATIDCLVIARHLFDLTGGAFDVALGSGLPSLELDPPAMRVRATRAGVALDLGGIGKGYAVDRMAELLEDWGLQRALVHGGFSSMLALEPPGDAGAWPLTLSDPAAPSRVLAHLAVRQTALSASGLRKGDHIVDPRGGGPAAARRASWVAVRRPAASPGEPPAGGLRRPAAAAVADALTTACMVLPGPAIASLCARDPGLRVWLLDEDAGGLLHFGG